MIIFKLTYKKVLFSFSTIFLTFIVFATFAPILRQVVADLDDSVFKNDLYNIIYKTTRGLFQNFVLVFLPVFVATKIPHFIAQEIHSGEILAVMAKPISRIRIIVEKFLAFQAVIFSWTLTCFGIFYFMQLSYFPYPFLFNFIQDSSLKILSITFVYQLIISILLIFISLKLKPTIILGIGIGIAIFNILSRQIITSVAANQKFQFFKKIQSGFEIEKNDYLKLTKGQKRYRAFYRYIDVAEHIRYIFSVNMAKVFAKYDVKNFEDLYNQEVLVQPTTNQTIDKLGKIVDKKIYIMTGFKNWLNVNTLYFSYLIITILATIFGFIYFKRKDIV